MSEESRTCAKTGKAFEVSSAELEFYTRMAIPAPTLCPEERLRRRMAYHNPITVYSRKSSDTGKPIFAMYDEDVPFPVIEKETWWSDEFDPTQFGREFDFNRSFFEQFNELSLVVPRFPLSVIHIEKSEYVNNATALKNCYLVFRANYMEDSLYCAVCFHSRDCIDCTDIHTCELCYNCIKCIDCYNLHNSMYCNNCSESYFLRNCKSCQNCFGCSNLYRKEFYVFNKPRSRQEYEAFLQELNLESYAQREKWRQEAEEFHRTQPQPSVAAVQVENVSGDYIYSSRNVFDSFLIDNGEGLHYCHSLNQAKDCMDYTIWGSKAELMYECSVCGNNAYNLKFCYECFENVSDLEYCQYCITCKDCFGCVGLRNKQYCVFNVQYSESEYRELCLRLKQHMRDTGEYGEFFPIEMSPIPYNDSYAQLYFPRSEREAGDEGLRWCERAPVEGTALRSEELPDELPEADDSITVQSSKSSRAFRITSEELRRYREFRVPLPRTTYDERMIEREMELGEMKLYQRTCDRTGEMISSRYPSSSALIVWDKEEWEREFRS